MLAFLTTACTSQVDPGISGTRSRRTPKLTRQVDLPADDRVADVWSVAMDPSGKIVAAGQAHKVDIWDWASHRKIATFAYKANPQFGSEELLFSPDGQHLAIIASGSERKSGGQYDVEVRLIRAGSWQQEAEITSESTVKAISFTADSKYLITAKSLAVHGNAVVAYESVSWKESWSVSLDTLTFSPWALKVSPDGRRLAVAGFLTVGPPANIVDPLERLKSIKFVPQIHFIDMQTHSVSHSIDVSPTYTIDWSKDGKQLWAAGAGLLEVYDSSNGARLVQKQIKSTHMQICASAYDQFVLVTDGNGEGTGLGIMIWDTQEFSLLNKIDGNLWGVATSSDAKYIVTGGVGKAVVWQVD